MVVFGLQLAAGASRSLAGAAALVMGLALGGCSIHGDFSGTEYQCGTGGTCPDGFFCVDGYCRDSVPDAAVADAQSTDDASDVDAGDAAGWDGGGSDSGVVETRCGTLALLRDDFADGVPGVQWDAWSDPGTTTSEAGGYLAVQIGAGSADVWGGYSSVPLYDLEGGVLAATVDPIGGQYTVVEARAWDGPRAQLLVENGTTLIAAVYGVASDGERASTPYDPGQHRHWRLRGAGGRLYWETSANGTAWSPLHDEAMPFAAGHVRGIVAAGGQLASASEARFAAVNPAAPAVGFCATSTLVDDFAAAPLAPAWDPWSESGCTIAEASGDAVMDFSGSGNVWCGAATNHLYDLRGSDLVLEVAQAPVATTFVTYAQVIPLGDDSTTLEIGMENGSAWFLQRSDGVVLQTESATWNATAMRFWRFSESGGQIELATSSDGASFTPRLTAAAAFDLSAVQVVIGAGHYDAGPGTPQTVRLAGVNAP